MRMAKMDDSLVLGIEPFDEHHKHLVNLLTQTYDMFMNLERRSRLEEVLQELLESAESHFAAEEMWMSKLNYPFHAQHKGEHDDFSYRVVSLQRDFALSRDPDCLETLHSLKRWLMEHINESDREYGRFIHRGCT